MVPLRAALLVTLAVASCGRVRFDPVLDRSAEAPDAMRTGEMDGAVWPPESGTGSDGAASSDRMAALDALAGGDATLAGDASARGDSAIADGAPDPDGASEADASTGGGSGLCSDPFILTVGETQGDTCDGSDNSDGCGPGATPELVYRFTASESGSYNFGATNGFPVQILDDTCPSTRLTCAGNYTTRLGSGDTVNIMMERSSGGCGAFTLTVTQTASP